MERFGILIFAALIITGCMAKNESQADLLIQNVTVYRGDQSPPFRANVVVRDGRFDEVSAEHLGATDAKTVIDGSGKFIMPGLWDMHAHIRSSEGDGGLQLSSFIKFGVTSILDLGGYGDRIRSAQDSVTDHSITPTVYSSYEMLNGQSFAPFQRMVTSEAEVVEVIAQLVKDGADVIKVHRALAPELLPIVIREAQKHNLEVTGHIPLGMTPLEACEAGMTGIEHMGSFLEAYISAIDGATTDSAIAYLLSDESEPLIRCLVSNQVRVTPTLVIYPKIAKRRAGGEELPEEFVDFIKAMSDIAYYLHQNGVTLLAGTDTSDLGEMTVPTGEAILEEFEMLQGAGITPPDIIEIATGNAARALSVHDQVGTIEEGKVADFLLLSADPGSDVENFRALVAVYKNGREYRPQ